MEKRGSQHFGALHGKQLCCSAHPSFAKFGVASSPGHCLPQPERGLNPVWGTDFHVEKKPAALPLQVCKPLSLLSVLRKKGDVQILRSSCGIPPPRCVIFNFFCARVWDFYASVGTFCSLAFAPRSWEGGCKSPLRLRVPRTSLAAKRQVALRVKCFFFVLPVCFSPKAAGGADRTGPLGRGRGTQRRARCGVPLAPARPHCTTRSPGRY